MDKAMRIGIVAPARKVSPEEMSFAFSWLQEKGMEPVYDKRLFTSSDIFAGDDTFRATVIQEHMDRPDIDAIWFARGGYGSIRIIDKLDFTLLIKHPKPFVGFSDSTVFHGKMQRLGIPSIHASMPYCLDNKTPEALQSLYDALIGMPLHYEIPSHPLNRLGAVDGEMVGGNLSVLYGMLGSDSFPETDGKILFLEEVDEYIYHIDRMMRGLKRAGKLSQLKALIIGGLTQIHDNPEPFGKTVEEVISEVVAEYGYPICFGFPAGHFSDNRAILLGRNATLVVNEKAVVFENGMI